MFLLLACVGADPVALEAARTPEERLDAALPGLAAAVTRYTEDLDPVADVVEAADPSLVRLLLPPTGGGAWEDAVGDGGGVELISAQTSVEKGMLTGEIVGTGVDRHGAMLYLDTRDGPAFDLRLHLGSDGIRASRMEGWSYAPEEALPGRVSVDGSRLRFETNLAPVGGIEVGHAGVGVAVLDGGGTVDGGPAGILGVQTADAVEMLVALAAPKVPDVRVRAEKGETTAGAVARKATQDATMTVAIALTYGVFLPIVAREVRTTVAEDARARLLYALDLDPWLADRGVDWRLGTVPATAKLLWAWPAGEGVVYGAMPLASETEELSAAGYRFQVPDIAALSSLRDLAPLTPLIDDAAVARDDRVWDHMRYRAKDEGMKALCDARALDPGTCSSWESDRDANLTLGPVDGRPIPMHKASSVTEQLRYEDQEGVYIGDCTTATTLTMAAWQAVGIVPLAVGYAGPDWYTPTHNQPLYFDGDRFVPTQGMPDRGWDADPAWVYVVVPPVGGRASFGLGWESSGWARGGSVAGGTLPYGLMGATFLDGVTVGMVKGWVEAVWSRAWPVIGATP